MTHTVDRESLERLMLAIEDLLEDTGQFMASNETEPSPNSKAAKELADFPDPELVATAYGQGELLIQVASEQVMCFVRGSAEPSLTIATWSVVRAVIESCALASWLLDPDIDVETRVKRSLAFRYDGLREQSKFARIAGKQAGAESSDYRIEELEQKAIALGFSSVIDKRGKRIGIGQEMPPVTQIAREALDEEKAYRLLSAVTHAHPWAVQQVGFTVQPPSDSRLGYREVPLRKAANPVCFQYLALKASVAFAKPVCFKLKLYGWDDGRFGEQIRLQLDCIRNLAGMLKGAAAE